MVNNKGLLAYGRYQRQAGTALNRQVKEELSAARKNPGGKGTNISTAISKQVCWMQIPFPAAPESKLLVLQGQPFGPINFTTFSPFDRMTSRVPKLGLPARLAF
jgi:hypothetical protein